MQFVGVVGFDHNDAENDGIAEHCLADRKGMNLHAFGSCDILGVSHEDYFLHFVAYFICPLFFMSTCKSANSRLGLFKIKGFTFSE